MKKSLFIPGIAFAAAAGFLPARVHATEVGPLIDVLVAKKILSPEDAEKVRADLARDNARTPAGKLQLADSVAGLKLGGDLRLRYQFDQATPQVQSPATLSSSGARPNAAKLGASPGESERSRERFRLRLGADLKMTDDISGGFQIATGQSADSNNETFSGGFDGYNIYLTKAFLGWKPEDWASVTLGKFENPLYTTDLVWDPDINPQGAAESLDLTRAFGGDGDRFSLTLNAGQFIFFDNDEFRQNTAGRDSWLFSGQLKAAWKVTPDVTLTVAPGLNWYNGGRASQLKGARALSDASFPDYTPPSQTQTVTTDTEQVTVAYDAKGVPTRTVTPVNRSTVTTTTDPASGNSRQVNASTSGSQRQVREAGNATTGLPGYGLPVDASKAGQTFVTTKATGLGRVKVTSPQSRLLENETDDLAIVTAPGDLTFKLFDKKAKFYWDFAWNTRGKERFENLGLDTPTVIATQNVRYPNLVTTRVLDGQHYDFRDSLAWLVGFQIGENKKKGDWSWLVNYRETGIAAVDPNLNDSDTFLSALNMRGIKTAFAWNIADSVTLGAAWSHGWSLRDGLAGGQASAIADLDSVDVFQIDLGWKF